MAYWDPTAWVRKGILAVVALALVVGCGGGRATFDPSNIPNAVPAGAAPVNGYLAEYGGSAEVYSEIAASTDCASLQATFDRAADNNDAAEPGTAEHRWTLGYMLAAGDRLERVGCY